MHSFSLFCLLLLQGCNEANSQDSDTSFDSDIEQRVNQAISAIESDHCFKLSPDGDICEFDRFKFDQSFIDPDIENNEAILVIDFDLQPAVNVLLQRDRVVGFFQFDETAQITTINDELRLPKTFGEVITGLGSTHGIPVDAAQKLADTITDVYGRHIPHATSHGFLAYAAMSDLTRHHPVVFLDARNINFHQAIPEIFCSVTHPNDSYHLNLLHHHAAAIKQQLLALYQTHHIKYINVSWGLVLNSIKSHWTQTCESPLPDSQTLRAILNAYQAIFEALFNAPSVFTAHAAYQGGFDQYQDLPYDLDRSEFKHRLRIGVTGLKDFSTPPEGLSELPDAAEMVPNELTLADLFINSGCTLTHDRGCRTQDAHSLRVPLGLGSITIPELSNQSSFVAPLGLAYFIHQRNTPAHCHKPMNNELITTIKSMLLESCNDSNQCLFHDPLAHLVFNQQNACGSRGGDSINAVPSLSTFGWVVLMLSMMWLVYINFNKH